MLILYIGNFLGNHAGFYEGPNQLIVDQLILNGYDVKYKSTKLSKVSRFYDIFKLIIKERKNAQLALIDTYSTQAFYFAAIASWLCAKCKIKYILVLHGGNLPERFVNSPKLVKWMFTQAFHIISPSSYLQQKSIEARLPKPTVISNPIDIEKYHFKQREKLQPKLLWVRSLQSIYNPIMALNVVEKLKDTYPTILLTIIGPDKENLLPKLQKIANEKKIANHVKFTGKLSLQDWTDLSTQCDVFINTTHIDNTPVSLLEAMALGLPVVSTSVGGIPFIVEHGNDALLCHDNDVNEMCESIKLLINDEDLVKKLTQNARNKIEHSYSSTAILATWMQLINDGIK